MVFFILLLMFNRIRQMNGSGFILRCISSLQSLYLKIVDIWDRVYPVLPRFSVLSNHISWLTFFFDFNHKLSFLW